MWEVADDEAFADVVASGSATGRSAITPTACTSTRPDSSRRPTYWYRFRRRPLHQPDRPHPDHAAPATSTRRHADPRPRLLPALRDRPLRRPPGHRHRRARRARLAGRLHLRGRGPRRRRGQAPSSAATTEPEPADLAGYRNRYALYKSDPDLQAAHASTPWFVIWDDHEVENDYAGDPARTRRAAPTRSGERRAAAYQAWWEHQPVRLPAARRRRLRDAAAASRSARWHAVPARRPPAPHRPGLRRRQVSRSTHPARRRSTPARTMLGDEQEQWLLDGLAASRSTWNILGNQTVLSAISPSPAPSSTTTSGTATPTPASGSSYGDRPGAASTNVVTLTGDIHAAGVADLTVEDENGRPGRRHRARDLLRLLD